MNSRNLELGYKIRRLVLEPHGGARVALPFTGEEALIVFPHDLKAFAIPNEYAACLAETYKRYLIASGILDKSQFTASEGADDTNYDDEAILYDRTTLSLFHHYKGISFIESMFNLDVAIEFVEQEANLARTLAIRWCMMMEYISFEDQRLVAQENFGEQSKAALSNGTHMEGAEDG